MFRMTLVCALFAAFFTQNLYSQQLVKIGHLPYSPVSLAGCWHHIDQNGTEWGLIGTSIGLSIVNLADPTQPVERFQVPGIPNGWRELRTWNGFAYVVSEAAGSGVTIVDLRELPDTVYWKTWLGDVEHDSLVLKKHTVQTADGYLYLFGGNPPAGAVIADLADPWNPKVVGTLGAEYIHDGFVRNDTLWASEFYKGWLALYDLSDKTQPKLITTIPTTGGATHNSMSNNAGNLHFSAGENPSAPLNAFDVSDPENVQPLDTYFPTRKPMGEVHNVRVLGDFLINPSYRGQLTIVDASRPSNLIETAWDSLGNSLVWDADPYLPSGIILATARNEGLFVYQKPVLTHACWLEGQVTDGITGAPLSKVKVYINGTYNADTSRADGNYRTGDGHPGLYDVLAVKTGYDSVTIPHVSLASNQVTTLNIKMFPPLGTVAPDADAAFQVMPSPFRDFFEISFPQNSSFANRETRVRLYDAAGRILLEKQGTDEGRIFVSQLEQLAEGAYLLVVSDGRGYSATRSIIKSR